MNVTTLLVLATLFISISNALPRTSYVKLIDIYLIFNLIIPFVEIILQTSLNLLEEDQEDRDRRYLSSSCRFSATTVSLLSEERRKIKYQLITIRMETKSQFF